MIKPIQYDREDTCPSCGSKRSLEAYDINNQSLKLSLSIDRDRDMSNTKVSYIKCRNCKREYFPKWISKYPSPMTDSDYEFFMNGFITSVKDNRI